MNTLRAILSCLSLLLLLLAPPVLHDARAGGGAHVYSVRREDSHIGFMIRKWLVIKEEGRFRDFTGTITYDPALPHKTMVEFVIQAASIDSRNEDRDKALRSTEFFDVGRFPTLSFRSTVTVSPENGLLVTGNLTIRGVTRQVTVPVQVNGVTSVGTIGEIAGFESTFTIKRLDFGVARGWDILGNDVVITLQIGASGSGC